MDYTFIAISASIVAALSFAVLASDSFKQLGAATPAQPLTATVPAPGQTLANTPVVRHLVWSESTGASQAVHFPTLVAIDSARDPGLVPFAADPNAAYLERRARTLTDQSWSENVWLTGQVDQARFDAICDAIERERQTRLNRIDVIVVPEPLRVTG